MNNKIVMSIDSEAFNNPELINLGGINLNFEWLKIFTNATDFRDYLNSTNEQTEIWVASNDDIEAINLAATAKHDRPDCIVCLVSFDVNGSLKSRAKAANIDTILTMSSLKERLSARIKENEYKNNLNSNTNEFKLRDIPNATNSDIEGKKAFVISVLSASGGAGKSSISAMCGMLLQAAGLKTLIIDADFQFGDLDMILGISKPLRIDELISNAGSLSQLKPQNNAPCFLAPPSLPELSEKVIEQFPSILETLKTLFDVIVINTANYWNEQQALLLERDSKSLFIIDQRPSSVNATKKAINLCGRCGIATGSILYTINRCSKHSLFSSIDISCALDGVSVAEIADGGIDVDEYMSSGETFELIKSRNQFATSLWNVLENILPENLIKTATINIGKSKSRRSKTLSKRRRA